MRGLFARMVEIDLDVIRQAKRKFIYLLVRGEDVVYVGQTTNVVQRVLMHTTGATYANGSVMCSKKRFDRVFHIEVESDRADAFEGALIRFFRPVYSKSAPAHAGNDNEVLASLGLPQHADESANALAWCASVRAPRKTTRRHRVPARNRERSRDEQYRRACRLWSAIDALLHSRAS